MNRFNKCMVATFMMAAMLFVTTAQAMEIRQYDKMALQDQNNYTTALIVGAQKVLIDEGKSDLAAQVQKLFTETLDGEDIPLGLIEFESNLDRARVEDARNAINDPHAQRIEVEDAMAVTLQKNHIDLPDSFYTVAKNFKPKFPPQSK